MAEFISSVVLGLIAVLIFRPLIGWLLEIANGQMAQTAFVKMCVEGLSGDEIIKLRADLLKYCKLDTLAMVKIVRYFCERP